MIGVKKVDLWLNYWSGPEGHLNYPPVRMGMDLPNVEIEDSKEKMAHMNRSPDVRFDTTPGS